MGLQYAFAVNVFGNRIVPIGGWKLNQFVLWLAQRMVFPVLLLSMILVVINQVVKKKLAKISIYIASIVFIGIVIIVLMYSF